MNFLQGKIVNRDGRQFVLTDAGISLPLEGMGAQEGRAVTYGIWPEHISIGEGGIPVDVSVLEPTGSETLIFGRIGGIPIDAVVRDRIDAEPGQTLSFTLIRAGLMCLIRQSGKGYKRWILRANG